jgi:hypothetical protein
VPPVRGRYAAASRHAERCRPAVHRVRPFRPLEGVVMRALARDPAAATPRGGFLEPCATGQRRETAAMVAPVVAAAAVAAPTKPLHRSPPRLPGLPPKKDRPWWSAPPSWPCSSRRHGLPGGNCSAAWRRAQPQRGSSPSDWEGDRSPGPARPRTWAWTGEGQNDEDVPRTRHPTQPPAGTGQEGDRSSSSAAAGMVEVRPGRQTG